jgi:hypothetical protein
MSDVKFTFHKDQFGVHVYYAGANEVRGQFSSRSKLKINATIDFDAATTCIVPPVTRVSQLRTESQLTGYRNSATGQAMTEPAYNTEKRKLNNFTNPTLEQEVELTRFQREWEPEEKEVEVHVDHEFEVVDIEYPADERLFPLRHLGNERINYFAVDGKKVAGNLAHSLCKSAGLKLGSSDKRGEYHIPSHSGLEYWQIEGVYYGKPTKQLNLVVFSGDIGECREYINTIECTVRACFDEWEISGKQPAGLTVGMVTKHLDSITAAVRRVETKKRTSSAYHAALATIAQARLDVIQVGLDEEENLNDSLDAASAQQP